MQDESHVILDPQLNQRSPSPPIALSLVAICLASEISALAGLAVGYVVLPHAPTRSSLAPDLAAGIDQIFGGDAKNVSKKINVFRPVTAMGAQATVNIGIAFNGAGASAGFFNKKQPPPAEASGLIVRSDGYIVTNAHVVKEAAKLTVTLANKKNYIAKVIAVDPYSDLAVIKIDARDLPVLPFAEQDTVRPGDWAIAIGSPMGFDHTVTTGIISSIDRSLADFNNRVELIQHSAPLNMGNSGGPLLDIQGRVIGLNTAMRAGSNGIGFATPSQVVADVVRKLIADGHVSRPYLGIYMIDVDPERGRSLTLPSHPVAVKVERVATDGPGDKAGILVNDTIAFIDGKPIVSALDVRRSIRDRQPGDVITIGLIRNDQKIELKLTLGDFASVQ